MTELDATTPDLEAVPVSGEEPPAQVEMPAVPVEMPVPVEEEEAVDALPVLVEARPLPVPTATVLPAVQAAAVAATSFVAGAATLALVRRHTARKLARQRPPRARAIDALPIVGSRTFIVDVHLLAKPGE
ncbi:MAG TPA: hypothetical protein VE992_04855 [Solirubrobacteraceae bacterium]|nr:hypothetical protein [Solirubrobacteraceae bacterium]